MITNDKILDNLIKLIKSNDDKNIKLASTILRQNNMSFEDLYCKKTYYFKLDTMFFNNFGLWKVVGIKFRKLEIFLKGVLILSTEKGSIGEIETFYAHFYCPNPPTIITKQNIYDAINELNINIIDFPNDIYEILPDE